MSDRHLRLLMAAPALATAAIAGYLLHVHYAGGSVVCSTGGCGTVARSEYSEIFGIPVALIGLIGSVAILLSLLCADDLGRAAALTLTLSGFTFAAYLVIAQLFVIHAICEWCVANDTLLAVLAVLAVVRIRPSRAALA
jgi:uncharacterized membrane protein